MVMTKRQCHKTSFLISTTLSHFSFSSYICWGNDLISPADFSPKFLNITTITHELVARSRQHKESLLLNTLAIHALHFSYDYTFSCDIIHNLQACHTCPKIIHRTDYMQIICSLSLFHTYSHVKWNLVKVFT